jgi:hypothetical protein
MKSEAGLKQPMDFTTLKLLIEGLESKDYRQRKRFKLGLIN